MSILAIDPGPVKSGWVMLTDDGYVWASGVDGTDVVLDMIRATTITDQVVAVEMIASYGMPVGREVFETCVVIGRFIQAAEGKDVVLVTRQQVKLHVCHDSRAKDPNIRQALIDLLGPPGTKAKPGPTYGVHGDAWAALGVAVTAAGMETGRAA